jgi:hypothetical protein
MKTSLLKLNVHTNVFLLAVLSMQMEMPVVKDGKCLIV